VEVMIEIIEVITAERLTVVVGVVVEAVVVVVVVVVVEVKA